jgi:hypothetical protein
MTADIYDALPNYDAALYEFNQRHLVTIKEVGARLRFPTTFGIHMQVNPNSTFMLSNPEQVLFEIVYKTSPSTAFYLQFVLSYFQNYTTGTRQFYAKIKGNESNLDILVSSRSMNVTSRWCLHVLSFVPEDPFNYSSPISVQYYFDGSNLSFPSFTLSNLFQGDEPLIMMYLGGSGELKSGFFEGNLRRFRIEIGGIESTCIQSSYSLYFGRLLSADTGSGAIYSSDSGFSSVYLDRAHSYEQNGLMICLSSCETTFSFTVTSGMCLWCSTNCIECKSRVECSVG